MADSQTCPVCGTPITDGGPYAAIRDRRAYLFCSQTCRSAFMADPGNYIRAVARQRRYAGT